MDSIDRKILALLQDDGRLSLTDLAGRIDLSVSRCQRRVRELERSGAIRGYRAVVDPDQLGYGFEVLAFATLDRPHAVAEFDAAIHDVPQVVEAQRLFGEPDYLLRVVSADLPSYQHLYDRVLSKLPGLRSLNSTLVMKETVPRRPLPTKESRTTG
ncbi:MAG TPA: Lrp/AsnC family transcriptional regulator [Flexivirga sp.]|uniref:Lrp/AsnC family transcriptional regulator n=1 Tax=Flexivirga sp. TaxID=1962927 RepID=UPI002CCB0E47|nr:Lrp/AsnC family transcriptional regulator [Flexivirga sp.]HWC24160.1 Lrp/AsnC family transcriptional regulator [Flexivirga sp.]